MISIPHHSRLAISGIIGLLGVVGLLVITSTNQQVASAQVGNRVYLPLIMRFPVVTKSHYMTFSIPAVPGFNPTARGQADADEHLSGIRLNHELIYILDWGQPCVASGGAQGAYGHDPMSRCHAFSEFEQPIKDYLDGYCGRLQSRIPSSVSGKLCGAQFSADDVPTITLVIGINNCVGGVDCANPDNSPSNATTFANGQAWGALINNISSFVADRGYLYRIRVAAGLDAEQAWNSYTNTQNWLNGLRSVTSARFYNYGNCQCALGYDPNYIMPRDWNYDKVHAISARGSSTYPLPEIYRIDGQNARQWQGLSKWAVVSGYGKIFFSQLLTTSRSCGSGGGILCNTPDMAVSQMNAYLNADTDTANGLLWPVRLTDITFYP